jgi:hypothetical protein
MRTSTTTSTSPTATGPGEPVGADLSTSLRALKLGGMSTILPERLVLARTRSMGHAALLQLVPSTGPT